MPEKRNDLGPVNYYKTFQYLTLSGVILILVGLSVGTYFFSEYVESSKKINQKIGSEEYASVGIVWVGTLLLASLALYELGPFSDSRSHRNFYLAHLMYKEQGGIFASLVLLGLVMISSIGIFVYYMFMEEEPFGMGFERSCPPGASLAKNLEHPAQISD